jgi:DNA-binding HxlR family transcriptional regulator
VDYRLTERGRELTALLLPLMEWVTENAPEIIGPQRERAAEV